jgi:hypothetical protein
MGKFEWLKPAAEPGRSVDGMAVYLDMIRAGFLKHVAQLSAA